MSKKIISMFLVIVMLMVLYVSLYMPDTNNSFNMALINFRHGLSKFEKWFDLSNKVLEEVFPTVSDLEVQSVAMLDRIYLKGTTENVNFLRYLKNYYNHFSSEYGWDKLLKKFNWHTHEVGVFNLFVDINDKGEVIDDNYGLAFGIVDGKMQFVPFYLVMYCPDCEDIIAIFEVPKRYWNYKKVFGSSAIDSSQRDAFFHNGSKFVPESWEAIGNDMIVGHHIYYLGPNEPVISFGDIYYDYMRLSYILGVYE